MTSQSRFYERAHEVRSLLETIIYGDDIPHRDASTQTALSIRDRFATEPKTLLDEAFDNFFGKLSSVMITPPDILNIKHCFPNPKLLIFDKTVDLCHLIREYLHDAREVDGIEGRYWDHSGMACIRIPELFDLLKKKSPYFNSTLPHVWWKMQKNQHYAFDIVRELKFFRQHLNGLDYDVTNYYLFLESEGIPMSTILTHPRVKAQVGLDFNVYHHCPEITKFLESPLFQKLILVAENCTTDTIERIKARIVTIAAMIYNLSRWSMSKLTTTDLIVNLTAGLAVCVPISVMSKIFKNMFTPIAQSSENNIRTLLKAFFLCLFVLIVGNLPGKHTVDEFINRIHKFPQAFESVQKFWKQIDPITQCATDYIESDLLGYDVIKEKTIMEEVQQWADLVEEYSDLYKKREIAKDKNTMLTAGRIHVDGVRLLSKCLRLHYSRENVELVRALLPTTYKISEIAIRSGADHSKPRREPLIIWFCGKSGVGKSTLTYPFLCDMMKSELGPNEELPDNWSQKIYARAPECEFWDGDPTDWMVYDDGFQIRDSVANPSPELFEIIRLGNMFPYMYHKASIEEKGNCFADVKGIVISSNIERIMAESIHCPEAVARRIKYAYKVHLKPEFRQYYIGKDNNRTYKLDKSKIDQPNLNVYQFQPFDPLSGEAVGHPLSYQDMLLQCALALRQLGDEFISYEHWLDKYRKIPFAKATAQIGQNSRTNFDDLGANYAELRRSGMTREQREKLKRFKKNPPNSRPETYKIPDQRVIEACKVLLNGNCLNNEQIMTLQWLFNSDVNIAMYARVLRNMNIEHLKKIFKEPPLGIYTGPNVSEEEMDAFYDELYSAKLFSKVTSKSGKITHFNMMIDPSCEIITPFRNFSMAKTMVTQFLFDGFVRKNWWSYKEFHEKTATAIKDDIRAFCKDPLRSVAVGMYESIWEFIHLPARADFYYEYFKKKPLLPDWPLIQKYRKSFKTRYDEEMRMNSADWIFRTHFPYVQSGPVVEELSDADVDSVRYNIQRYRMRVKKIAKDAWAYTQANWPNMLLYAVGAISLTYSLYKFITPDNNEEDEEETNSCFTQSLDESGSKTQPRPRARVQHEDRSSGPQTQRQTRARIQNLDVSGPSNAQKVSRARVQAIDDLRPEWAKPQVQGNLSSAVDHQLYSILDSKIYANTFQIYITPKGEDRVQRRIGHVVALRGSLFLANYHFVPVLREPKYKDGDVIVRQGNSIYHRCATGDLLQNHVRVRDRDLVIFEMKRKGVAFADLVKHIQTKSVSYSHSVQNTVLARYRMSGLSVSPFPLSASDAYLSVSPISIEMDLRGETTEIVNAESWLYTGVTFDGDCGALLLISNNRVPTKIVGVHNAFDPYAVKAISVPLYREEIEETMAYFQPRLQYGWEDDFPFDVRALEFDQGENFNVVRCEEGTIPTNSKSRLAKSPIFEQLIPTLTKPGYLRPFKNKDGDLVDPARIARAKWGYHLPVQDQAIAQRVTNAVVQVFMKEHRPGNTRYYHPMTTEEAIVGVDGVEGLNSINKVSSPGYPYVFHKIPGRGKTGYFGQHEFDLSLPGARQIINEVHLMERDILNNRRPFVVWIDTLKDARIPIEKAERGKTRIFSAGPMAFTILYRKYFLPPIAHVMWNRIENHVAVGINPTSPEWHTLALKLKSKGKHCIAGDYACFDGKAPTEGYLSSLEFFKAWYIEHWEYVVQNRGNVVEEYEMSQCEFTEFLGKIFLEVVNHIHLMEHEIDGVKHHLFYSVCNGQPSGNPGTAKVNSAQGLWMAIRCWLELTQGTSYCTISQFFDHVYLIDYGDDVAMNVSSEAVSFYNQNTLTRVMKKLFDIDFTDEKKTGDAVPDSRLLSEITFLKRGFVFNEDIQMYVCPMEVETLLDILNWTRTGAEDPRVITINNIASVVAELALVSQEAFDYWVPRLKRAYTELSWRVNKEVYFDTRFGYLLAFRNAQFKAVSIE